jgi:hypothetical protein
MENLEINEEERQVIAEWLSDKSTLDDSKVKASIPKNENGYIDNLNHPEVQKMLVFLNIKNPFNYIKWINENQMDDYYKQKQDDDKQKILLGQTYEDIIETLDYWLDIKPEYKSLIALWTIGTYLHKCFPSYPYLFINAMRGSGKTRLLRLIKEMAFKGELIMSLTEAVLFRSDNNQTMCIDEFEGLGIKEKATLRELLNSCYKKGTTVKRLRKSKTVEGEKQVLEEFELYRPLVMANISGMEEVLGDRCVNIFLEKSVDPSKTLLFENLSEFSLIRSIKTNFNEKCVSWCSVGLSQNIYKDWNLYVKSRSGNIHYPTHIHNLHNPTYLYTDLKQASFFNKIIETEIVGRSLELFFPIFCIAYLIDEKIFNEVLEFATKITKEKRKDEVAESKDVMLYQFISENHDVFYWYRIKDLTLQFKEFINADFREVEDINTEWMGHALKRLSLVTEKKRDREGMKVMLDIDKARNKSKMFRKE